MLWLCEKLCEHVVGAEYFHWDTGGKEENGSENEKEIKSGKEKEEDYYKKRASPLCTDIATPDGFF